MKKKSINNELSSLENPGEKPEVYAVKKEGEGFKLSRRDFIGMAGLLSLSACAGNAKKMQLQQNLSKPSVQAEQCNEFNAHQGSIKTLLISPDGKLLFSGSADTTIKLWSLPDGVLIKTLSGHYYAVKALAITPDGSYLVSGSQDKSIKLWPLPDGVLLKTLKGHTGNVGALAISPDGRFLISGSSDKSIRSWSLPDGVPIGCLSTRILPKPAQMPLLIVKWMPRSLPSRAERPSLPAPSAFATAWLVPWLIRARAPFASAIQLQFRSVRLCLWARYAYVIRLQWAILRRCCQMAMKEKWWETHVPAIPSVPVIRFVPASQYVPARQLTVAGITGVQTK